ncbi:alanine--tRNA ligase [Paenisporosarcina cavernae]|uniref:Alanine--tRNA ligase n=1 Tax=Paenisporosarcina cavernae TaxID=2320858 RepID=A0A385YSD7_9BACL|nr:alanine--tRNA ligase [Paenisporosarcina cavernae]AYC29709.1 alanine--tRNA ligase [Paenisporosarcina cavernae]
MKAAEIRRKYLDFFVEKEHAIEPSAPLVPINDASLLWINSGVATLKKYFDGRVVPSNPRITNAQKSIRTNDIENVGITARHHTFFEMLGNFSIGEYFKKEAIEWAWEFLTDKKWMGFDPEKLSVTVHPEDEEAYAMWRDLIGIPEDRIIRLEGNFWDIGEGPSGPNSEIFYDRGESYGQNDPAEEMFPGGENERYLEIWNLVFSEFNHNPDHTYTPLPKQNIDTGMGLERMACVVQDVPTNFETDLFMPIIRETEKLASVSYGHDDSSMVAYKVIADHVRTVAFAIGDGALPSNEGRGYVLRRLLRRAVRYAKTLGIDRPFLYTLVPVVGEIMVDFYPEVLEKKDFIMKVMKTEEERFHETLQGGLDILTTVIAQQQKVNSTKIPGEDAFKLYDTYGFPVELTEEFAQESGMTVDMVGFEQALNSQRDRARAARKDVDSMQVQSEVLGNLKDESKFVGYDTTTITSQVVRIVKDGQLVNSVQEGDTVQLILNETPFYAESGGQIADEGQLVSDMATVEIKDVQKAPNGQNLHTAFVASGELSIGDEVTATVNMDLRNETIKNHTATHLLHQALKEVLGTHVNQAGSYVGPERLRFDFSHFGQMSPEELERIETKVNEAIWQNLQVVTGYHGINEAKEMGAMALFGEKYGDIVRVVSVGDYSLELCGGCHVQSTSQIGLFKLVSESGIGAGTRRIEAVTGRSAFLFLKEQESQLDEVASLVKSTKKDVIQKVNALLVDMKQLQKENESLSSKLASNQSGNLLDQIQTFGEVQVLSAKVEAKDNNQLRQLMDDLKSKVSKGVLLLAAVNEGKVMLISGVTKDLEGTNYHAGKLVNHVAMQCDGKGGGRPDMAMAGAKDPSKLDAALQSVYDYVKSI